jgi:hypothetical protein
VTPSDASTPRPRAERSRRRSSSDIVSRVRWAVRSLFQRTRATPSSRRRQRARHRSSDPCSPSCRPGEATQTRSCSSRRLISSTAPVPCFHQRSLVPSARSWRSPRGRAHPAPRFRPYPRLAEDLAHGSSPSMGTKMATMAPTTLPATTSRPCPRIGKGSHQAAEASDPGARSHTT